MWQIQWGLFDTAEDWWKTKRSLVQIIVSIVAEVAVINSTLGLSEWARMVWHKQKRARNEFMPSCGYQFRTQSGAAHTVFVFEVLVLSLCNILSFFGILPASLGRFVVIVLFLPLMIALTVKKWRHNANTWSGGFGTLFAMAGQPSLYALGMVLFPMVSMVGGSYTMDLVCLLVFLAFFAVLFSAVQAFLHASTEEYHAPQFLFVGQTSFHAYVCFLIAHSPSNRQFWSMASIHWAANVLVCTGATAQLLALLKRCCCNKRTSQNGKSDKEMRLQRLQYYFLLNLQGRYADLLNSVMYPIMTAIDAVLDPTDCALSCGMDKDNRFLKVEIRFLLYIIADLVMLFLCLGVYALRFTIMCLDKPQSSQAERSDSDAAGAEVVGTRARADSDLARPGSTARQWADDSSKLSLKLVLHTWHALWYSFTLHFNRYVLLFLFCSLLSTTYVAYNTIQYLTPNPRWASSSSSSFSSSLFSDSYSSVSDLSLSA